MLSWLQQLYWREPLWLCLALQPLLLLALRSLWRRQRLRAYAEPALQAWVIQTEHTPLVQKLFSRDTAYLLAWLLLAIAAAGPRLPLPSTGAQQVTGINLMIVVDNSRSMSVSDILPSRIRRARLEIEELLAHAPGNRIGVITYAAQPHLYVPLSRDYAALRSYLSILDELVLPTHGSRIGAALAMAHRELSNTSGPRAVLLVTDGDVGAIDDKHRQQLAGHARQLADSNMPLFVLGTGSIEGDAIPLASGGWLTDNARPVISRMDEALLKTLASAGQGGYSVAYDDDSDWQSLYTQGMATLVEPGIDAQGEQDILWQEFYAWFLLPGLLLLYVSLYPYRLHRRLATAAPILLLALGISLSLGQEQAHAADYDKIEQRAYLLYEQGEYRDAARQYAQLNTFAGRLGEAASLYRQGDYAAAIRQYSAAVLHAESDSERATALYNLGNSYFRIGDYETAIMVYRDALHYQPGHVEAQQNLTFSTALLEEVSKRLAESVIAQRGGNGARRARAETGIDIAERGGVSVDDSEDASDSGPPPAALGEIDSGTLDALIQRGLEHVQLAGAPADSMEQAMLPAFEAGLEDARLQTRALQDRQAHLWKRVFELEEGFAAELDTPLPVKGVSPW
ncbi:MAG: VWA domain-containing protein [Granulosicoccaceae bacterium]|jgi:Ca-activated chloride channel family protein